jgi:hypothetical protein
MMPAIGEEGRYVGNTGMVKLSTHLSVCLSIRYLVIVTSSTGINLGVIFTLYSLSTVRGAQTG